MIINADRLKGIGFRSNKEKSILIMGKIKVVRQGKDFFHRGEYIKTFEELMMVLYEFGKTDGRKELKKEFKEMFDIKGVE